MRLVIIVAVIIGLAACAPKWHQLDGYTFEKFIHDFKKDYKAGEGEFLARRSTFLTNLAKIIKHNLSGSSYKMGVNKFTDMTIDEIKASSMGLKKAMRSSFAQGFKNGLHAVPETLTNPNVELPNEVDWRNEGVVSPVKDQGGCGSCWAFSSAEVLESHAAISAGKGKLKTLSTQQLVSCMPNPLQCGGAGGCEGAIPELAFSYVSFYGLTSEYKYSYSSYYSGDSGECTHDASTRQ